MYAMIIEKNSKEIIIRLSADIDTEDLQDFLNYARYKELTSSYKTDQKDVDKISKEINADWWSKNRSQLLK